MPLGAVEKALDGLKQGLDELSYLTDLPKTPEAAEVAFLEKTLEVQNLREKLGFAEMRRLALQKNWLEMRLQQLHVGLQPPDAMPTKSTTDGG